MSAPERPLPDINDVNLPYWESAKAHALALPVCVRCGHTYYPMTRHCPRCLGTESEWRKVAGTGTLVTWNVMHQVYDQAFAAMAPYIVAVVQLTEGPQLVTNLVNTDGAALHVGLPLTVQYLKISNDVTLPVYSPSA